MEITSLVGLETFSLCKSDKRMKRYLQSINLIFDEETNNSDNQAKS